MGRREIPWTEPEPEHVLPDIWVWTDGGPWAKHNMPCAVCGEHWAVLHLGTGAFAPCWDCQEAGWVLIPPPVRWWDRLLRGRPAVPPHGFIAGVAE